jgi:hypothetical protein
MKTIKWLSLAVLGVTLAGCDIYEDENESAPVITVVVTSNHNEGTYTEATLDTGTGVWSASIPSICDAGVPHAVDNTLWVTFNKQMDPTSVQTSVDDCTPAGDWLAVSIAAPAGEAWYTCYSAGSPTSTDGASVVIFLAADTGADGWSEAVGPLGTAAAATAYTFTGTIQDQQGRDAPIDVEVTVAASPGDPTSPPGTPADVDITSTTVELEWAAPDYCEALAVTYDVERAPDDGTGAPGTWAAIATGLSVTTYTDTGLTPATIYFYRIVSHIGTDSATSGVLEVETAAP